jgi:hypothetical protein
MVPLMPLIRQLSTILFEDRKFSNMEQNLKGMANNSSWYNFDL